MKGKGKGIGKNKHGPYALAHNMAGDNSGDDHLLEDSDHEDVTVQEDVRDYSNVTIYPQGDPNDRTDEDTGDKTDPQGRM